MYYNKRNKMLSKQFPEFRNRKYEKKLMRTVCKSSKKLI